MVAHDGLESTYQSSDVRWFVRQALVNIRAKKDVRALVEIIWNVSKIIRNTPSVQTSHIGKGSGLFARAVLLSSRCNRMHIRPAPDFDEHAYLRTFPDVREGAQAGRIASGFAHYVLHGRREGRLRPRPISAAQIADKPAAQLSQPYIRPLFSDAQTPLHFGVLRGVSGKFAFRVEAPNQPTVSLMALGIRGEVVAKFSTSETQGGFEIPIPAESRDWVLTVTARASDPLQLVVSDIRFTASPSVATSIPAEYAELLESGVFDPVWYRRYNYDLSDDHAFDHFYFLGRQRGHQPSFYFDSDWYLQTNADVRRNGDDPLLHYIRYGQSEGRRPAPVFDPAWYASRYKLRPDESALADFLKHRRDGRSPCPEFDSEFYLQSNPDVQLAGADPVEHYALTGYRENRNPSSGFDTKLYIQRYLDGSYEQNPLVHYIVQGFNSGLKPTIADFAERGQAAEVERFVAPGPDFEEWQPQRAAAHHARAKAIAFYLPQFHAIPENDRWWGKGFTEWTNLSRGQPRCRGHYQPRIPRDLGFYDLSNPVTIRRQVELAKAAGLFGFCFYFYWFNKQRLLDTPLELFLNDTTLDFPFCLIWANENWTRRWDGRETEILIKQDYDPRHDEALVDDFAAYFAHRRYIRIGGRPLFFIYRPDQVPNARARFATWREQWRSKHGVNPLFYMAQSFANVDPTEWGLDGALEFPPHQLSSRCKPVSHTQLEILDPGFTGTFYRYEDLAAAGSTHDEAAFPLIKTVAPSWDNDARRQGRGTVFLGSTPAEYERWLRNAIEYAREHPIGADALVFINAWNEWAEGAYLEPDVHFGSAYLNATARAIYDLSDDGTGSRILLIGHDAYPHGAQAILLSIARTLRNRFGADPTVLLLDGGPLLDQYHDVCRTIVVPSKDSERDLLLQQLHEEGYRVAITNTTVSGALALNLKRARMPFISLIHELPRLIRERGLQPQAKLIAKHAEAVVFPHAFVRDAFLEMIGTCDAPLVVRAQGNYNATAPDPDARATLRRTLGIDRESQIVINVGYGDLRKGFDLFVAAARQIAHETSNVHFVWLGNLAKDVEVWLLPPADDPVLRGRFHHHPFVQDARDVMNVIGGSDLFFLSSREDPYPTVLMEAYAAGLDLLAYQHAGGFEELVRQNGQLLSTTDASATARAIQQMLAAATPARIAERRAARRPEVENELGPDTYTADLLGLLDPDHRRVSVIVPNYNYARHLRARLASIFEQTYPIFEVIVLDDASTDESLEVIEQVCAEYRRDVKVVTNRVNSGSAFRQWRKGLEISRGEYIWIAEADDVADRAFLGTLMRSLVDHAAAFGFTDSWLFDERDRRIGDSYSIYNNDGKVDGRFSRDFVVPGRRFAAENLSVKNTILNASAVVWRRKTLVSALAAAADSLDNYKVAGDWRLYVEAALADEPVAYVAQSLNGHRRHSSSITHALERQRHLDEIIGLHSFVAHALKLEGTVLKTMKEYEAEIATQFGLQDGGDSAKSHPKLSVVDE